jgi:hypothetical protein
MVPVEGPLDKGRMDGIGNLLYELLMAPSAWLIVKILSDQSK